MDDLYTNDTVAGWFSTVEFACLQASRDAGVGMVEELVVEVEWEIEFEI